MNGIIGIHVEANSPGYSRDNAIAVAKQIGGRFALIVNDPLLCMMMLDIGVTPIYRINRQGFLDDNAQHRGYSARDYVRQAHMEVPDKRVIIHVVNEPGQNDLDKLNAFVLEAINEANALGRTLAVLNFSYGNPEPAAWTTLAPCVRAAAAGKHYVCFHEGVDIQHPTLASCYPYLIGRFLDVQKRFGFKVLITEWAASKDAHNGWQTWMSASQYASVTEDAVKQVYLPAGVEAVLPFTVYQWNAGFDYFQSDELKNAFRGINLRNPTPSPAPTPPTPIPYPAPESLGAPQPGYVSATASNLVNCRANPTTKTANVLGALYKGDSVSFRPKPFENEGFIWTRIESPYAAWIANVATITSGEPPKPDTPTKLVDDIVYVSQLGTDAALRDNDCIISPSIAWTKLRMKRSGFGDMPLLKVDNLVPLSPLATNDKPVTFGKAQEFITSLGVPHKYRNDLTPDEIVKEVAAGRPPIILVNYRWIKAGSKAFGHYLLVVGYSEKGFWLNDSYEMGERYYITRETLIKAQTDLKSEDGTQFASIPYQGLALVA